MHLETQKSFEIVLKNEKNSAKPANQTVLKMDITPEKTAQNFQSKDENAEVQGN